MASLVTPAGSGGIAVIQVWGTDAAETVGRVFRPKSPRDWRDRRIERLYYGYIIENGAPVDEVIVRTAGQADTFEINCHGGVVAASQVLRVLVAQGAAEADGQACARRAAESLGLDAIQFAALTMLRNAQTRLAVRVLCDQLNGALSGAIRGIRVADGDAAARLGELIASGEFGLALVRPRRIALLGRPNVGKSSLFNALVGHNRTIVSPLPGTTRDLVSHLIVLGGYPVELVDTAGLRERGSLAEMKGAEAARRLAAHATLPLLVVDRSAGMKPEDRRLLEALRDREPILAANKADLPPAAGWRPPTGLQVCEVSALTGLGLARIEDAILRRFPDRTAHQPGSPVAFDPAQTEGLSRARESVLRRDLAAAERELAQLTLTVRQDAPLWCNISSQ